MKRWMVLEAKSYHYHNNEDMVHLIASLDLILNCVALNVGFLGKIHFKTIIFSLI